MAEGECWSRMGKEQLPKKKKKDNAQEYDELNCHFQSPTLPVPPSFLGPYLLYCASTFTMGTRAT